MFQLAQTLTLIALYDGIADNPPPVNMRTAPTLLKTAVAPQPSTAAAPAPAQPASSVTSSGPVDARSPVEKQVKSTSELTQEGIDKAKKLSTMAARAASSPGWPPSYAQAITEMKDVQARMAIINDAYGVGKDHTIDPGQAKALLKDLDAIEKNSWTGPGSTILYGPERKHLNEIKVALQQGQLCAGAADDLIRISKTIERRQELGSVAAQAITDPNAFKNYLDTANEGKRIELAHDPYTPKEMLVILARPDQPPYVRAEVAVNQNTPKDLRLEMITSQTREQLVRSGAPGELPHNITLMSESQLLQLAKDPDPDIQKAVAVHPKTDASTLHYLTQNTTDTGVLLEVARNPNTVHTDREFLARYSKDPQVLTVLATDPQVNGYVIHNEHAPPAVKTVATCTSRFDLSLIARTTTDPRSKDPQVLAILAQSKDPDLRELVAKSKYTSPEVRAALATDPNTLVRMGVCMWLDPPQTDQDREILRTLSKDQNEAVRLKVVDCLTPPKTDQDRELLRTMSEDKYATEEVRQQAREAWGYSRTTMPGQPPAVPPSR